MNPVYIESILYIEDLCFLGDPLSISVGDVELHIQSSPFASDPVPAKAFGPTDHRIVLPVTCGWVKARTCRDIGLRSEQFETAPTNRPAMLDIDRTFNLERAALVRTWEEIEQLAARTVRLCRWIFHIEMTRAEPIHVYRFVEPRPGEKWGAYTYPVYEITQMASFPKDASGCLSTLLSSGVDESVARALLHEATTSHERKNWQAALALAIAAAEVAVKTFIADVIPSALWLVQNLPAPPIDMLCRDYLPNLAGASGTPPKMTRELVAQLEKGMKLRNKLIHRGKRVDKESSFKTLRAVGELLNALEEAQSTGRFDPRIGPNHHLYPPAPEHPEE